MKIIIIDDDPIVCESLRMITEMGSKKKVAAKRLRSLRPAPMASQLLQKTFIAQNLQ